VAGMQLETAVACTDGLIVLVADAG
jgi:hypothetical protein